jgi:hypothetical protein
VVVIGRLLQCNQVTGGSATPAFDTALLSLLPQMPPVVRGAAVHTCTHAAVLLHLFMPLMRVLLCMPQIAHLRSTLANSSDPQLPLLNTLAAVAGAYFGQDPALVGVVSDLELP